MQRSEIGDLSGPCIAPHPKSDCKSALEVHESEGCNHVKEHEYANCGSCYHCQMAPGGANVARGEGRKVKEWLLWP